MSMVAACFAEVPDPRTGDALRHDFLEVLTIALTASVCGAETCVDFSDFAVDREPLFRSFLVLEHGPPSHDTFSRIFRLIEPGPFNTAFSSLLDQLGEKGAGVLAAANIDILPFAADDASDAADIRAGLERAGTPIGPCDIPIAAQPRRRRLGIVKLNTREFRRVPDLTVVDWSM